MLVSRVLGCHPRNVHVVDGARFERRDEATVELGVRVRSTSVVMVVDSHQKVRELVWWWLVLWVGHVGGVGMNDDVAKQPIDCVLEHPQQLEVHLLEKDGSELALVDALYVREQYGDNVLVPLDVVELVRLQCLGRSTLLDSLDLVIVLWITGQAVPRDKL